MKELEALLKAIDDSPEIKRYRILEKDIMSDDHLQLHMNALKDIQKQLVHARQMKHEKNIQVLENKLADIHKQIDTYPHIGEYFDLQSRINAMLKDIVAILEEGIEKSLQQSIK